MKSWQFQRLCATGRDQRLFIQGGRDKGKFCKFRYGQSSKASVLIDGEKEEREIAYLHLEELDEFGKVKILPVMDMTGGEVAIDSYICYSVPAGRNSHAMEIGKVFELTKTGAIKVRTVVRNGDKIEPSHWRRGEVTVNDPFRSIRLPVDDKTMLMWIMQDFDELAKAK